MTNNAPPWTDCNLTTPDCKSLGYCKGHSKARDPARTDPLDTEQILLDIQKNTDVWWNTPREEYKGKNPAEIRKQALASINSLMLKEYNRGYRNAKLRGRSPNNNNEEAQLNTKQQEMK